MHEMKILVTEDDRPIMNLICTALKIRSYTYLEASTGKEAITLCASHQPDLILLDLGLPDMDGIEVIRTVRQWSQVPIIVISARWEDTDKIEALDSGADDYLTKPFSVEELLARIRSVQRRMLYMENTDGQSVYTNGDLVIDYAAGTVKVAEQEIHLTPNEYKLLCLLARNTGRVLTHTYIIDHIWGNSLDTDIISLRVYMNALRKKISMPERESLIRTHIGIGYQMIRM